MKRRFPVSEVFRKDPRAEPVDPYRRRAKYPSGTRCPDCGLVFSDGAWRPARKTAARRATAAKRCPACLQIRDDYPGGVLRLAGGFVASHRQEVLRRARNVEKMARRQRPLERIYRIEDARSGIVMYSTDEHLATRIGKALRSDFGGTLEIRYGPEDQYALVKWSREE